MAMKFKVKHLEKPITAAQLRTMQEFLLYEGPGHITRGEADKFIKQSLSKSGWPVGKRVSWPKVKLMLIAIRDLGSHADAFRMAYRAAKTITDPDHFRQNRGEFGATAQDIHLKIYLPDDEIGKYFTSMGGGAVVEKGEMRFTSKRMRNSIDAYETFASELGIRGVQASAKSEED